MTSTISPLCRTINSPTRLLSNNGFRGSKKNIWCLSRKCRKGRRLPRVKTRIQLRLMTSKILLRLSEREPRASESRWLATECQLEQPTCLQTLPWRIWRLSQTPLRIMRRWIPDSYNKTMSMFWASRRTTLSLTTRIVPSTMPLKVHRTLNSNLQIIEITFFHPYL